MTDSTDSAVMVDESMKRRMIDLHAEIRAEGPVYKLRSGSAKETK